MIGPAVAGLLIVLAIGLLVGWPRPDHDDGAGGAVGSAMPTCPLSSLPAQAADTVRLIHAGGPFPHPRNDGVVFGNREAHLPARPRGFYHEYTVITPGKADRGMRRIVTGGGPPADPPEYYYTGDHYDSFCAVAGAGEAH